MEYADDMNVVGRPIQNIKEGIEALEKAEGEDGLLINKEKSRNINKIQEKNPSINKIQEKQRKNKLNQISGKEQFGVVSEFKYLVITLTGRNEEVVYIQYRKKYK